MTLNSIAVEIRDVKKSFDTKKVLKGVSLQLHYGEILAVLGGSGTGKTLLLKMIVGLEKPDSGYIYFEKKEICALTERQLYHVRAELGYVFQDGALFDSLTVEENLEYPLKLHTRWSAEKIKTEINERLDMLGLSGAQNLFPDELSGGMKKRVGLARATMLSPKIVLFDEPTAGLDPNNVARFARTVEKLKHTRGLTGIFVTHDIPCALAISDRIALLHEGKIHVIGTTEEIRNSRDPLVREFIFPDYTWRAGGDF